MITWLFATVSPYDKHYKRDNHKVTGIIFSEDEGSVKTVNKVNTNAKKSIIT